MPDITACPAAPDPGFAAPALSPETVTTSAPDFAPAPGGPSPGAMPAGAFPDREAAASAPCFAAAGGCPASEAPAAPESAPAPGVAAPEACPVLEAPAAPGGEPAPGFAAPDVPAPEAGMPPDAPVPGRPGAGELLLRVCAETPDAGDCHAALLLDGAMLGASPAAVCVPRTGELFLTALPLGEGGGDSCYGVTRVLRFADGELTRGAPDVVVYDWGGGAFEAVLCLPSLPQARQRTFPYTVAQLPWETPAMRERLLAVLYYDEGMWLSVESSARVLCGFPMPGLAQGELYTTMGCLVAVTRDGARQEALVVGPDRQARLRVQADELTVTDGCITAIDRLGTQCGHERRTRYRCHGARWDAEPSEIGFFTREPAPVTDAAQALLEALLCGAADEAMGYLSAALAAGLDAAALAGFFGPFTGVRPCRLPGAGEFGAGAGAGGAGEFGAGAGAGRVFGLLSGVTGPGGAICCRRFRFVCGAGGLIENIEEEDGAADD